MRKFAFVLLILFAAGGISWLQFTGNGKKFRSLHLPGFHEPIKENAVLSRLKQTAAADKDYIKKQGFHTGYYFLVDMSLPSGQNRFFVFDLTGDSVLFSGLVTHGRCNEDWLEGRKYNNVIGGGCTSLGRYRIGTSYHGRFGLAFKLHGLEQTNSNAFKRYVVLHAHECVPQEEVSSEICQSDGCPTVAPGYLKDLESLIKSAPRPVLLHVFDPSK